MSDLFNSLLELIEAFFGKSSEGATDGHRVWNYIECTTSLKLCHRYYLQLKSCVL